LLKVVPGEAALIFSDGEARSLLVSDLHLGLEKEMAKKGFSLPSYSVKMLERIKGIAEKAGAERAVILGDVKHSVGKVEDIDWSILPWFFGTLLDLFSSVDVVPGNHDGGIKPLLPQRVKLHASDGAVLGDGDEKCLRLTVREDERRFTRNNLQQAYSMSGTISLLMKVLSPVPLSLLSGCSSTSLLEGRPRF